MLRLRAATRTRRLNFSVAALPQLKPRPEHKTLKKLLQETTAFLPEALANNTPQLRLWDGILASASGDVQSPRSRPLRLVVWGSNHTATRDLVTALLEEPFASDTSHTKTLRTRWETVQPHQTSLSLEYSNLPLAFLSRFQVPIQLIETHDPADLNTADVAVVVARVAELQNIPQADLVVLNMDDLEGGLESRPRASTSRNSSHRFKCLLISPSQATSALLAIEDDSTPSPEAIQRYQTAFIASRMPHLIQSLTEILASFDNTSLQKRTALAKIRSALSACRTALADSRAEVDRLAAAISELRAQMEDERVKVHSDVLGQANEHIVDRAVDEATVYMKSKIDYMRRWHRSMWTIDEITTTMAQMVQRVWRNDLEKELIFHSGRLEQLQRTFTARAFNLISSSNTGSLHSPVLDNTLKQIVAVPTFKVQPSSLLEPLVKRSSSIIEVPTARLHVAGQRALFGMGGAIATGMTISWTGYLGFFMNTNGLMGSLALEPGTAVATGMLVSVLGVHWASRRWNKGLKVWLADFIRVAGGIKQDVTDVLNHTMEKQVLVVAETGCAELSRRIMTRQTELAQIQERLECLLSAVDLLEQKPIE
ncbi:hypothetical protein C8F01DRAFT_1367931 [Mycena amicta]|nr:hypothetical protein C8F01DRAFT_1367931 [Mycena amicta]